MQLIGIIIRTLIKWDTWYPLPGKDLIKMEEFDLPAFFRDVLKLPDEALIQRAQEIAEVREINKGEIVIREGDKIQDVLFLIDGIFRGYFFGANGKEITDCFVSEVGFTVMPSSDLAIASILNLEAVVPSRVLAIPLHEVTSRIWRYRSLQKLYFRLMQKSFDNHRELKHALYKYNATERYQWFCQTYPDLVEQVREKDIASFLNMTPVTLSRVRQALHGEK